MGGAGRNYGNACEMSTRDVVRLTSFPVAATEDVEAYPRQYDNGHEPELHGSGRNGKAPVGAWIGQRKQNHRHDEEEVASAERPRVISHNPEYRLGRLFRDRQCRSG